MLQDFFCNLKKEILRSFVWCSRLMIAALFVYFRCSRSSQDTVFRFFRRLALLKLSHHVYFPLFVASFLVLGGASLSATESEKKALDSSQKDKYIKKKLNDKDLAHSNLILAYDFSASNATSGYKSFFAKNLHHLLTENELNPYEQASIKLLSLLRPRNCIGLIDVIAFADKASFKAKNRITQITDHLGFTPLGLNGVLEAYRSYAKKAVQAGPSSYYPAVRFAARKAHRSKIHTILLIMTDGGLSQGREEESFQAIIKATKTPLSIVIVGLGDGSEDKLGEFSNLDFLNQTLTSKRRVPLKKQKKLNAISFENIQFINSKLFLAEKNQHKHKDFKTEAWAVNCFEKLVQQKKKMQKSGLLVQSR